METAKSFETVTGKHQATCRAHWGSGDTRHSLDHETILTPNYKGRETWPWGRQRLEFSIIIMSEEPLHPLCLKKMGGVQNAGKRAQWVQCLLCKHEELTLDPQHKGKVETARAQALPGRPG